MSDEKISQWRGFVFDNIQNILFNNDDDDSSSRAFLKQKINGKQNL